MSGFYADHDAIRRFGRDLAGLADGVATASSYNRTWVPLPSGADGEIFRNFAGIARDVDAAVTDALAHLDRISHASAAEVAATAAYYESTDAAEAARMDAGLARVEQAPPLRPGGPGSVTIR